MFGPLYFRTVTIPGVVVVVEVGSPDVLDLSSLSFGESVSGVALRWANCPLWSANLKMSMGAAGIAWSRFQWSEGPN